MAIENVYAVKAKSSHLTYEFISEGPAGKILKRVQFSLYEENLKVYNLALGDVQADDELDDSITTNNADILKVLTTVAYCVHDFLEYYPDYSVFAIGNTTSRTRLYRMAITNNLKFFPSNFYLFGLKNNHWFPFENEMDYEAFLITKKSLNLDDDEE